MLGFDMSNNKNHVYLPVNISEALPNLEGYIAAHCSIKEISMENFRGLNKLKTLYLFDNLIEKIPTDAFNDLIELDFLSLRKN